MGEAMTKFLDTAPGDKPFCLSVSFNVPHGSQTTSMFTDYPEWQKMTRPASENPKLKGNPFYDALYRDRDVPLPADTGTDPYRFIPKFILDQDKGRRNQTYAYDDTRTILDYAGVEAPPEMEGSSLRPLVEGKSVEWRDELFLESLFAMRDNPFQEGIRTKRWKYIRMYDGVAGYREADVDFRGRQPEFEMLFDLETDPTEHVNLATDPAQLAMLTKLRGKTAAQSIAINERREAYLRMMPPQPRAVPLKKAIPVK